MPFPAALHPHAVTHLSSSSPPALYFHHPDHLDSASVVTDSAGAVVVSSPKYSDFVWSARHGSRPEDAGGPVGAGGPEDAGGKRVHREKPNLLADRKAQRGARP